MVFDFLSAALMVAILAVAVVIVFRNTNITFFLFRFLVAIDIIVALATILRFAIRLLSGQLHSTLGIFAASLSFTISVLVVAYVTVGMRQGQKIP